jgi:hypothetical protein
MKSHLAVLAGALLLAVPSTEEVNAQDLAGGYKIDLVFGDSQCEPRPAHDQAERLIREPLRAAARGGAA